MAASAAAQEAADDGYAKEWGCSPWPLRRRCPISSESSTSRGEVRDDPTLAVELNNLAEAYRLLDRFDEAEALYLRAVELDEAGPSNAEGLATSLNNLALVYRAQGPLDEAERSTSARSTCSRTPSAPVTGRGAQPQQSRPPTASRQADRARPLQERAVAIAEASLGREHPTTEQRRRRLAEPDKPPAKESRRDADGRRTSRAQVCAETSANRDSARGCPVACPARSAARTGGTGGLASPAAVGSFAVQVAAVPERGQVAAVRAARRPVPVAERAGAAADQSVEVAGKGTFTACSPARSARAPKRRPFASECARRRGLPLGPARAVGTASGCCAGSPSSSPPQSRTAARSRRSQVSASTWPAADPFYRNVAIPMRGR